MSGVITLRWEGPYLYTYMIIFPIGVHVITFYLHKLNMQIINSDLKM